MTPYWDEDAVAKVLRWDDLIPAMRQAMRELSAGAVVQPVRQMLPVEHARGFLGVMPAVARTSMGLKLVSFYPHNEEKGLPSHLAMILLFDPDTGLPLAIMDGRLITEMRTAAVSAVASDLLAPADARVLALLGSGVQAESHLAALREIRPIEEVRVWSRTPAHAARFAERHGVRAMAAEQAVRDADIVVCATAAIEPVLRGAWLKPGAHVNTVGSPRPDWRECDDAAMANTLIVDSREACLAESGDVILSKAEIAGELGELIAGTITVDPAETSVFKSLGQAIQDVASARLVYDKMT